MSSASPVAKGREVAQVVFGAIASVWMLGAMFYIPYVEWRYAQTHGFWYCVLPGQVCVFFESYAWPLDVWNYYHSESRK